MRPSIPLTLHVICAQMFVCLFVFVFVELCAVNKSPPPPPSLPAPKIGVSTNQTVLNIDQGLHQSNCAEYCTCCCFFLVRVTLMPALFVCFVLFCFILFCSVCSVPKSLFYTNCGPPFACSWHLFTNLFRGSYQIGEKL